MLSDLSFIDWAALLIAVALLIITAIAAYLSHANSGAIVRSTSSSPLEYQRFPSRPPAHAASDWEPSFKAPPPPIIRRSQPPLIHQRSTPPAAETTASSTPKIIDLTAGAEKAKSIPEQPAETVAERAARLRRARSGGQVKRSTTKHSAVANSTVKHSTVKRPVSESKVIHKTIPVEANQPLTFAGGASKLSAGVEKTTSGFSVRSPGFFEDPIGRHEQRYWDGSGWTEHCKEGEERFTDPL